VTRVHLDFNATSPLREEALGLYAEIARELAGNPSSLHHGGRRARHLLDEARERVAAALGAAEDEIVFTSGGTESNNLALLGCLRAGAAGASVVTTAVEHSSVLGPAARLEREGHPWRCVAVDGAGLVTPEAVAAAAEDGVCALVSVQTAGNEVGQVMPLAAIAAALERIPAERRPRLHTDAVQALGRLPIVLGGVLGGRSLCGGALGSGRVDLASFSAHKVGGPPGVGILFRRRGIPLEPLQYGGEQEGGLRPGTESVAAIAAAGLSIELAVAEQASFAARAAELARGLWEGIRAAHPRAVLLGPPLEAGPGARLPGTLNTLLPGVDGKVLVTRLDLAGLEVSAGSACASGSLEPSHVLLAMGLSRELARAGLRLSIGRSTTWRDVREAVEILRTVG
jgi:cysteine desulfurase